MLVAVIVLAAQLVRPVPEEAARPAVTPSPNPTTAAVAAEVERWVGPGPPLWLFYGGEDRLQRLDVATGEHAVVGMRARPLLVTGPELVLGTVDWPLVGWASLEDPSEMPDGWRDGVVAPSSAPGEVWFHLDDSRSWLQADLVAKRDGTTVEIPRGVDVASQPSYADGMVVHGIDLVDAAGHVYERDRDGWRRVRPGALIGFTENTAAIETCATLRSCEMTWYDRTDWSELVGPPSMAASIAGGEIASVIAELLGTHDDPALDRSVADLTDDDVSLCCDGAWLAVRFGDAVALFDLEENDSIWWSNALLVEDGGRILLAQKPS